MPFGIDTFIFHLDIIPDSSWNEFKLWNGGHFIAAGPAGSVDGGDPVFAGRNFLGGDFQWGHSEATDSSTELQGHQGATEPSPSHPENLKLRVPLVAPMQAPETVPRQTATGARGLLYGAIDAVVLCRKIFWSIYRGEFEVGAQGFVQVWLAVDPDHPLSIDYWAGWADQVASFYVFVPYGSLHPVSIWQPFMPCIRCKYTSEAGGRFKRDVAVTNVLDNVQAQYPALNTKCFALWADTVDPLEEATGPNPKLDWTKFDKKEVPILWRFSNNLKKADGSDLNEMFSVDGVKEPTDQPPTKLKATNFMLTTKKWQPNAKSIINIGFSITDGMTDARVRCTDRTPLPQMADNAGAFTVRGGRTQQIGRYIRIRPVDSMSLDEAQRLSAAGFEIFTVWESGNVLANAQPKVDRYFDPAFHAGTEDGNAAFAYCGDELSQPPQTPIFFCVDYDAPRDVELDQRMGTAAQRAHTEQIKTWVLNYFSLVKFARDQYAQQNPDRFYLIGAYAGGEVLRWLYKDGTVNCFWQAVSFAGTGSQPPRWPWYHANRWQYQFTGDGHDLPTPWNCVGGIDPDADWGDGGSWILTDPLPQRLTALELGEKLAQKIIGQWGNLLDPNQ
jgi:hypothetical protein